MCFTLKRYSVNKVRSANLSHPAVQVQKVKMGIKKEPLTHTTSQHRYQSPLSAPVSTRLLMKVTISLYILYICCGQAVRGLTAVFPIQCGLIPAFTHIIYRIYSNKILREVFLLCWKNATSAHASLGRSSIRTRTWFFLTYLIKKIALWYVH